MLTRIPVCHTLFSQVSTCRSRSATGSCCARGAGSHGRAVHLRRLSRYERYVLQLHKQYDLKLDAEARLAEIMV